MNNGLREIGIDFNRSSDQWREETNALIERNGELTEGSSSNVFIVRDGVVAIPIQDNHILPEITRRLTLDILQQHNSISVEERIVTMQEVRSTDEIWITNSVKEIGPVVTLDGTPVGDGKPGAVWEQAARLFEAHKFDY